MIQVYYRPIEGLKPLHLALMGVMEVPGSPDDFELRLSVERMMVDHAIDDLVSWSLAERETSHVVLTPRGKLSLCVWVATNKAGYWKFENAGTWFLGKGTFFFRSPLPLLSDAGLDPETGEVLSTSKAKEILKSFHNTRSEIDERIKDKRIAKRVSAAIEKKENHNDIITEELSAAITRLQLNQMSKIALKLLSKASDGELGSSQRLGDEAIRNTRERLADAKEKSIRAIKDRERLCYSAERVLLADWFEQTEGLLKSVAEADPNSLRVVSECGDASWAEERMVPESVKVDATPEESLFASLGKLIGSFFR